MSDPEVQLTGNTPKNFRTANAPGISWFLVILLLILLALAVIIFGPSPDSSGGVVTTTPTPTDSETPQPRIYNITYDAGVFSPTNLRIHAGDTVRFKNESIFPIRIVSDDIVGFDSVGDVPQGSYFSFTFAVRGTFTYYNGHNKNQIGTIIVR